MNRSGRRSSACIRMAAANGSTTRSLAYAAIQDLRKISLSPFARLEAGMEQIGSDYVVCFKPN